LALNFIPNSFNFGHAVWHKEHSTLKFLAKDGTAEALSGHNNIVAMTAKDTTKLKLLFLIKNIKSSPNHYKRCCYYKRQKHVCSLAKP
jgi:hypothetical protein